MTLYDTIRLEVEQRLPTKMKRWMMDMFENYVKTALLNTVNDSIVAYCKRNGFDYRYNMQELEIFDGYYIRLDWFVKNDVVYFKEKITDLDKVTLLINWGYDVKYINDLYENNNLYKIEILYCDELRKNIDNKEVAHE
jgi:hypothetical protein